MNKQDYFIPNIDESKRDDNGNLIIQIQDNGLLEYVKSVENIKIKTNKNNTIILHKNNYKNCSITLGNNNFIYIDKSKFPISGLSIAAPRSRNCSIKIGRDFSCFGVVIKANASNALTIGNDCMFSYGIYIWMDDGHTIIDENGTPINYPSPIIFGDHVWCGFDARILKGSEIPSNSVIGMGSIVNKKFVEKNIIIAGIPAKIIKRKCNWDRKNVIDY